MTTPDDTIDTSILPDAIRTLIEHASLDDLEALDKRLAAAHQSRKLENYRPQAKQRAFHAAGSKFSERLFQAGNQLGKTHSACVETALHLTGLYDLYHGGWEGRRFEKAPRGWALGETVASIRDSIVTLLLGPPGDYGTGLIPKDLIVTITKQQGTADAVDSIRCKHVSGGTSSLSLKSYKGGADQLAGATLDFVHVDETPDELTYVEVLARITAGDGGKGGCLYMTATPVHGINSVIDRYYPTPKVPSRFLQMSGIDDAEHLSPEQIAEIKARTPSHLLDMRLYGIPQIGDGRVYEFPESDIMVPDMEIPAHWKQTVGVDFGQSHPYSAVRLAFQPNDADPSNPTVYVTYAHKKADLTISQMAAETLPIAGKLPVAFPHDFQRRDPGTGVRIAQLWRQYGLNMCAEPARFPDIRSNSPEAGVQEIRDKMANGTFKVFASCHNFWTEYRTYHRKNGILTETNDDVMDATRIGYVGGLQYAERADAERYRGSLKRKVVPSMRPHR